MAENTTNKDRLKDITDSIETGIKELFQSDKYMQYLQTMSRFHKYSVNNTMLIYMQKPDATLVAGFNKWRDQFERSVKKGEHGIKIIAPTPFKKKIEQEKLDPDTKMPLLDADGKVVIEEKEIKVPMYKPVTVFDVSQTDGKPLPTLASDLAGNVQNYDAFMEALRRSSPVPIAFEDIRDGADGYFHFEEERISIREGMSEVQTVSAAIHEITHAKLHNREQECLAAAQSAETADVPKSKNRRTEEVEAESVSYAVCAYYGIATGENSFGYIAAWSKDKELPELRASLETINKTASGLITDIDRNYTEIIKERGLDKAEPEIIDETPVDQSVAETLENTENTFSGQASPLISDERTPEFGVEEAPQEHAPDNGYMPDPAISIEAMNAYGYTDGDMLPLSKERAIELFERDITVYMIYDGNGAGMAFEPEDIQMHTGIFGVTREEWESVKDSVPVADTDDIQKKRENSFLNNPADSYAIYQLRNGDELRDYHFEGMERLQKAGLSVEHGNYELVYTGELHYSGDTYDKLNGLYQTFNINHPADFTGHSLSVSDIVALKQDGVISCHYVDSFGFQVLPAFLKPENYLKNAEMAMEDDYGMLDGIINNGPKATVAELEQQSKSGQPISLMDLAAAVKREQKDDHKGKRPSVLEQLRAVKAEPLNRITVPKSAELEL